MVRKGGVAAAAAVSVAGAVVAAYLLDPDRGRARRAKLSDQSAATLRRTRRGTEAKARDGKGRAVGAARRAKGAGTLSPADDRDIKQGVVQHLKRVGVPTTDLMVDVVDGVATLRGQVPDEQALRTARDGAFTVPGVRKVKSYLHLPGQPAPNKADALRASD